MGFEEEEEEEGRRDMRWDRRPHLFAGRRIRCGIENLP
jgi:hypothetical protein